MAKAAKKTDKEMLTGSSGQESPVGVVVDAPEKGKGGRPTAYKAEYVQQAKKLTELGATDREVAEFFEVTERTIYRWQHEHPEFCQALKVGKDVADDRVEKSLYRRAIGYSHDAVKIMQHQGTEVVIPYVEHTPPDVTACIFWLKNRRKGQWRDRIDHANDPDNPLPAPQFIVAPVMPLPKQPDE